MISHIRTMISARLMTIVLILSLTAVSGAAQEVIRLTGKVVSSDNKEPLTGVSISDASSRRVYAMTDLDGRFAFNIHIGATLRFSMVGAKTATVKVRSAKPLTVELDEENISIGEVVVAAKRVTDKVLPEPTDIEVKGNYFHVKTRVRVPRQMFSHNTRLVVQPILNDMTRKELKLMKPMVFDAQTYNDTQDRMYNFDMNNSVSGDPLAKYITIKSKETREKGRDNDIIGYTDSIYVEHVKDDFSCDVYMAIENYNRILYRDTTIIARGTVNPLRWLDYSFAANEMTDPAYLPKPEKQLRDSRGEINLRFPIAKAEFDTHDPANIAEIDKMRKQIEQIAQTKDATLQSLSIEGTSSPEGKYNYNIRLAKNRLNFALNYLRSQVPEEMRQGMEFTSNAKVAPWESVVTLMRKDSLDREADQVEEAIQKYGNIDLQGRAIRNSSIYPIIKEKYLPQLRRVGYVMNYTIFRQLTFDEIKQLYEKDYKQLTQFEFFTLYRGEKDEAKREKIMRQSLEVYPSFMTAANDLSAALINRHAADPDLLKPFAGSKAPKTVNTNQMVALLNAGLYTKADSLAQFVPEGEDTHLLLAVNSALNGRYQENMSTIAKTGIRNEVVMLLAMKRNEEAMKLCKQLPTDQAVSYYLKAVCLNRLDDPVEAYKALKKAIEMDPSLESIAKVDGDVNDLMIDNEKEKK